MTMDETLYSVAEKVQNFAVIYLVDITEVPDFNKVRVFSDVGLGRGRSYRFGLDVMQMYELYDPCTVMFFYRYVQASFYCFLVFDMESHLLVLHHTRNKHIMIDLGTGNNNKM